VKLPRRRFLHLAAGTAALPVATRLARAQAYPARPVRLIVGYPPGGGTDIIARLIGQWLSEHLGQPFVIDNRAGANTNIGTEVVVRAPPDGYTFLVTDTAAAINATVYPKLNFNFIRDIAPVASIASQPLVMEVHPSIPAKSVPEFIAYAKANPGRMNMASAGNGNLTHVCGEMFKMMTGVNLIHVPYRGTGPAVTDLLSGHVQVMFGSLLASIQHIRTGAFRALAMTTAKRSDALPDIPSLSEFLPGYAAADWKGIGAPRNTPPELIEKLHEQVNAALADPKLTARLAELGGAPLALSSADFGKLIADDTDKWGKVARAANIRAD
jgi:tripartite-type tricarboxylate transporter receptor subunit TctC